MYNLKKSVGLRVSVCSSEQWAQENRHHSLFIWSSYPTASRRPISYNIHSFNKYLLSETNNHVTKQYVSHNTVSHTGLLRVTEKTKGILENKNKSIYKSKYKILTSV